MNEKAIDFSELTTEDTIENMYLTFQVAQETYAVNIASVTEIVGMQRISEIPDVPPYIKGAMNLRGKVIPVMDQRLRFGLPAREYGDRTTIIVLDLAGVPTGLVVDEVTDVLTIAKENIDPPPHWLGNGDKGIVQGLGKMNGTVSIILDVPQLVTDKQLRMDVSTSANGKGGTNPAPASGTDRVPNA